MQVPVLGFTNSFDIQNLFDAARASLHDDHAVRQVNRLFHRVGDEQHRARVLARKLDQLFLHHHPGLRVQRTKGLVHQQHIRVERVGAGNRHALLHAT